MIAMYRNETFDANIDDLWLYFLNGKVKRKFLSPHIYVNKVKKFKNMLILLRLL